MAYTNLEIKLREMIHQGYSLRLFIEGGGAQVNEIAKVLDISRQGVNGLYGQVSLDKTFVEKLKHKGYKIPGITAQGGAEILDASKKAEYQTKIEMQERLISSQRELIEELRSRKRG